MDKKNKFALKSFFKDEGLKPYNFDIIWNQMRKKIEPYQKEIKKNIKKMGDSDDIRKMPNFSLKNIYDEYQQIWKEHQTVKTIKTRQLKQYFFILFPNPNEGLPIGLYDNPKQFNDFLSALILKNKQSYLKKLVSDLLFHYPKDKPLLFERLKNIYNKLDKQKNSNQALLKAKEEFELIEENASRLIAQNILDIKKDLFSEILSQNLVERKTSHLKWNWTKLSLKNFVLVV